MEVLSTHGRSDVALDVALQTSYPSWGYMIHNENEPATTLWELWNADTTGPSMNSRNHIMFGSVSNWFYKYLAGITPTKPGYRKISIKPTAVGHSNLTHMDTKIVTPYGDVLSSWKIESNPDKSDINYTHIVSLPPGVEECSIVIPIYSLGLTESIYTNKVNIFENDILIWTNGQFLSGSKVQGIKYGRVVKDGIKFNLLNGQYKFTYLLPERYSSAW